MRRTDQVPGQLDFEKGILGLRRPPGHSDLPVRSRQRGPSAQRSAAASRGSRLSWPGRTFDDQAGDASSKLFRPGLRLFALEDLLRAANAEVATAQATLTKAKAQLAKAEAGAAEAAVAATSAAEDASRPSLLDNFRGPSPRGLGNHCRGLGIQGWRKLRAGQSGGDPGRCSGLARSIRPIFARSSGFSMITGGNPGDRLA